MSSLSADAQVIVVGAGPAGATTAAYLAGAGVDVLVLEKTAFPREKVCGDGLTPRATYELQQLGIDLPESEGWIRNHGLRLRGGATDGTGVSLEVPWPDLSDIPGFGLVRTRKNFDETIARKAQAMGARLLEETAVTGPILDEEGRVVGVKARNKAKEELKFRAPVVVAADGNSARLALSMDIARREDRPMGVAVRAYFNSPRHDDDWLESWVELWAGEPHKSPQLPGYGWIFGVGDGTSNVGLGILNSSGAFQNTDYRQLLKTWTATLPEEWGYTPENMVGQVRGAALPMGFNRTPHYDRGLVLVGDAGGMVNPFNGEGIAYAMESGRLAADIVAQAVVAPTPQEREAILRRYPELMREVWGGYFTLGRMFVHAIGHPSVMRVATKYGLPRMTVMKFAVKLLANLTDRQQPDAADRLIHLLCRMAPAA